MKNSLSHTQALLVECDEGLLQAANRCSMHESEPPSAGSHGLGLNLGTPGP